MCMHDQRGRGGSGCGQQWCEVQEGSVSKWGEQDCGVRCVRVVSVYVCMCLCLCMVPFMSSPGNVSSAVSL